MLYVHHYLFLIIGKGTNIVKFQYVYLNLGQPLPTVMFPERGFGLVRNFSEDVQAVFIFKLKSVIPQFQQETQKKNACMRSKL